MFATNIYVDICSTQIRFSYKFSKRFHLFPTKRLYFRIPHLDIIHYMVNNRDRRNYHRLVYLPDHTSTYNGNSTLCSPSATFWKIVITHSVTSSTCYLLFNIYLRNCKKHSSRTPAWDCSNGPLRTSLVEDKHEGLRVITRLKDVKAQIEKDTREETRQMTLNTIRR